MFTFPEANKLRVVGIFNYSYKYIFRDQTKLNKTDSAKLKVVAQNRHTLTSVGTKSQQP